MVDCCTSVNCATFQYKDKIIIYLIEEFKGSAAHLRFKNIQQH